MNNDLSPAEFAVLGLVSETPRHGYEIEQVIAERGMRDWTEVAFSSIYYLLGRLAKRGLVSETAEGKGRRKTYAVTPQGRATLAAAVEKALAHAEPHRSAFLVALANWPALDADTARAALTRRCAQLEATLGLLRGKRAVPLPAFVTGQMDYSIAIIEAELRWLRTHPLATGADDGKT